jgi:hypothetical protein
MNILKPATRAFQLTKKFQGNDAVMDAGMALRAKSMDVYRAFNESEVPTIYNLSVDHPETRALCLDAIALIQGVTNTLSILLDGQLTAPVDDVPAASLFIIRVIAHLNTVGTLFTWKFAVSMATFSFILKNIYSVDFDGQYAMIESWADSLDELINQLVQAKLMSSPGKKFSLDKKKFVHEMERLEGHSFLRKCQCAYNDDTQRIDCECDESQCGAPGQQQKVTLSLNGFHIDLTHFPSVAQACRAQKERQALDDVKQPYDDGSDDL